MFRKITLFCALLALVVVVLGAYVRLSEAGLGCPDWPACYGQIVIGDAEEFTHKAEQAYPGSSIDVVKAWKEMGHRYAAGVLAVLVLALALISWREKQRFVAVAGCVCLILLIGVQAGLGLWTVKLKLMPLVVSAHLLIGFVIFWLLYGLYLRTNPAMQRLSKVSGPALLSQFAGLFLVLQVLSGVWVSANHAGLACAGFPQCNGQWWPQADYQAALNLFHGLMTGYRGELSYDAQVAAHWLHRVGALISFVLLTLVMLSSTLADASKPVRKAGLVLSLLLFAQIGLGIAVVKLGLPLWLVAAHHATAAVLMLPVIAIRFYSRYGVVEKAIPTPEAVQIPEIVTAPVPMPVPEKAPAEEVYVEAEPETLYRRLKSQLKRTRTGLGGILASIPLAQKAINDDLLEEIEASLLMADIGIDATTDIIRRLTESLERHQLNDAEALEKSLKQELLAILKPCSQPLHIPKQDGPFVILVVGVNGAGKTTTIGKMAKRLQAQGYSVMLAAGDTFRAAAVEQLQTWGERNNIHVVAQHTGADSASVIYDGVQSAQSKGIDILIADTAGRLHTKANLMEELKKVKRIMGKLDETAPHEVLLVLDAGTGQNAVSQARLFNETVPLTGIALTKLDGTAKGGVIFALAKQFGVPIRFIGIGEGIDDLQDFDAESFVEALFVRD
ncbi:MAG: signal recognition particle-docking protein FtsY [Gammaproteobacteria bacterium]